MKIGVVVFPGSNCDRDTLYVFNEILDIETVPLWHKETDLKNVDAIIIPGGFSYGDYLRSGALARFSPIMSSVENFVHTGGNVLGICNGFQVLCEAGLLPGTLRPNEQRKFVCKNIFLQADRHENRPTALLPPPSTQKFYTIPIAHGEGNYYAPASTLAEMRQHNQILFRYCNELGETMASANPNGSVDNIAGICDKSGRIVGMMPHPERAADFLQGNQDGVTILAAMVKFWESNLK